MSYINRWRKDNAGSGNMSNKNQMIQQMCEDYITYLNNAPNSVTYVKYYDNSIQGLCTVIDVNVENTYGDEKYITTLPNANIGVGDLIFFKDTTFCEKDLCWIIRLEEGNVVPSHKKFRITPCRGKFNIRTKEGIVTIPSYFTLTTSRMSNYSGDIKFKLSQPINYTLSDMITYMSAENAQKYVYEGMRYLLPHNGGAKAYKINFIDCTKPKIVTIQAEETPLVAEDDIENLIAYNNGEELENSDTESVNEYILDGLDSFSGSAIYKVDNVTKVDFTVDDEELARVEIISDNSCKVIGLKEKEYITLIAKIGGITLTKDILIKKVGE